jgi:hypothetical protein
MCVLKRVVGNIRLSKASWDTWTFHKRGHATRKQIMRLLAIGKDPENATLREASKCLMYS